MDLKQYISSGILEQYALGMTTAAESKEVEQYVRQYPEVAVELDAIQIALETLAAADARAPRPGFEADLMAKLDPPAPPDRKSVV